MYDDKYRLRFDTMPIASFGNKLNEEDVLRLCNNDGVYVFTGMHNHSDFEILLIKQGSACFRIGDREYNVCSGDVVVVNPYEVHWSYICSDMTPFEYYCFTFDLSVIFSVKSHPSSILIDKLTEGSARFSNHISNEEVRNKFEELQRIFDAKNYLWEYYISARMYELFAILIENDYYINDTHISKNRIFIKNVQKYIENNYCERVSSSDAAKELGYDKSYFCRLFKKNFGSSFGDYLNFHRMTRAKEMLLNECSVSETALSCGFSNISYFSKVFRQINHITPSEFSGYIHCK